MWERFKSLNDGNKIVLCGVIVTAIGVISGIVFHFYTNNKLTDEDIRAIVKKEIIKNQPVSLEEEQSLEKIIASLQEATQKEKRQALESLSKGDLDMAINVLGKLHSEQQYIRQKNNKELAQTNEQLAALYTYKDPDRSFMLLKEAVEIDPTNAPALSQLGLLALRMGKMDMAIEFFEKLKQIADTSQTKKAALGNLGVAYMDLGQNEKAISYHEQALTIAREIKDRRGEGNHLGNLGVAYYKWGKNKRARDYYRQALTIAREIKDRQSEGNHLGNLGVVYSDSGRIEKAIRYYKKALSISHETDNREGEVINLGNLGNAYFNLGQNEKAINHYEQALTIAREVGDRQSEGKHLYNLGSVHSNLGQIKKARDYLQQAHKIFVEIKSPNAAKAKKALDELADS